MQTVIPIYVAISYAAFSPPCFLTSIAVRFLCSVALLVSWTSDGTLDLGGGRWIVLDLQYRIPFYKFAIREHPCLAPDAHCSLYWGGSEASP